MMEPVPFTVSDIETALLVKAHINTNSQNHIFLKVSTDSRNIEKNDLFLALKGDNFDGADFVTHLFNNGIKGFIVQKDFFKALPEKQQNTLKSIENRVSVFKVDDTLKALGLLAKFQRLRCKAKIIAITGSNGKTTTKEITSTILKGSFNTLTTRGNFNNQVGLPLTLLRLSYDHEWAIVEMGMNHPGEISRLADIARPDIGIITNTSKAHLEGLKNVDNVAHAKAEMFQHMENNSIAIINMDDPRFIILKSDAEKSLDPDQIVCFGTHGNADFKAESIKQSHDKTSFTIIQKNHGGIDVTINSPAPFMVTNALAACAAAVSAGVDTDDIKQGLSTFTPVKGRMNFLTIFDKINLIDDTYNANPDSVKHAIITLSLVSGKNRSIAVLGDMLELGKDAPSLHKEIGKLAVKNKISKIYTHGKLAARIVEGAIKAGFSEKNTMNGTREEIAEKIMKETDSSTSWVLVKGSRGMEMEKVIHTMQGLKNP